MKHFWISSLSSVVLGLFAVSCGSGVGRVSAPPHDECAAVYYWKTVFRPDSAELEFVGRHDIGRMYVRMFDVTVADCATPDYYRTVPNATLKFGTDSYNMLRNSLSGIEFVPVVYVTLDALKSEEGREGKLASNIATRVRNMCSYNEIPNVGELQIDCDWTVSTEESFFRLCDSLKRSIAELELPWRLSSTIRLHQLARKAPPVDNGVLMVYNTGSFDNPHAANSIIDAADVEPYLKHLPSYPIHLDVAYPVYSWQLLFRRRQFAGLLNGLDLTDTARFEPMGDNRYAVRHDIPYRNTIIRAGDVVRQETSSYDSVSKVKAMIEKRLSGRKHSNILYHLDSENLSKYTPDEIDSILSAGN